MLETGGPKRKEMPKPGKVKVRMRGFEPPYPKALPPEDSVSTNFTTCAYTNAENFFLCAREDSNLHTRKSTSPSSWRVYRFHHVRIVRGQK